MSSFEAGYVKLYVGMVTKVYGQKKESIYAWKFPDF